MIEMACKSCNLRIRAYDFTIDLIDLRIDDFDVIIGIDWLFDNHVIVNY